MSISHRKKELDLSLPVDSLFRSQPRLEYKIRYHPVKRFLRTWTLSKDQYRGIHPKWTIRASVWHPVFGTRLHGARSWLLCLVKDDDGGHFLETPNRAAKFNGPSLQKRHTLASDASHFESGCWNAKGCFGQYCKIDSKNCWRRTTPLTRELMLFDGWSYGRS